MGKRKTGSKNMVWRGEFLDFLDTHIFWIFWVWTLKETTMVAVLWRRLRISLQINGPVDLFLYDRDLRHKRVKDFCS